MASVDQSNEAWHKEEIKITQKSHIDEAIASRAQSLDSVLVTVLPESPGLRKALIALAEATAHIAVHLQNYVQHTYAGSQNASGDEQLHLDILCDEEVFNAARASGVYSIVASEETPVETEVGNGEFSLACDPLDGSSIVDANFAVGSIYGIWPGKSLIGRKGREQVASAVAVYGPRTLLAIAVPSVQKVIEVTLVQNRTLWETSRDPVVIEPAGKIFAPGNLRATTVHQKYAQMMDYWMKNQYQLRYSGGMVPDVYHILAKGKGIFSTASCEKFKAKLRLLYEVAPLGLVIECAGGLAIHEGKDVSVLDITIEHADHRLGVCLGSRDEVNKYKEIMFA